MQSGNWENNVSLSQSGWYLQQWGLVPKDQLQSYLKYSQFNDNAFS